MSELEMMTTKTCPCGREFAAMVHKKGKQRVFCDECREHKKALNKAAWLESLRMKKEAKLARRAARQHQETAEEALGLDLPEL